MEEFPRIGVGVVILKDSKILLGKRIGKRGAGEYSGPGGHLEYMETIEECCIRETKEECGIEIENIRFLFVGSLFRFKPRHYVHIKMIADWKSGEPEVLEPDKCAGWDWYDLDNLPEPLMETEVLALKSLKDGQVYYKEI